MIDASSITPTAPFQYGPIITGLVVLLFGAFGWAIRRVLARIDTIGGQVNKLGDRVLIIETKQNLVARKTGITERQLKDAEQ